MGSIRLRHLSKSFGDVTAIEDVNIDIKDGEIVSFLGPSGCGKTTTLRLIAGLETPTAGEIYLDDELVSGPTWTQPPEKRNLGMVFQNYAVWPHMTVLDNVCYPLKVRRVSKRERHRRATESLALVGMEKMGKRFPEQLSGGQQQRVALARALVMEPTAMLLDEPLSNLDAKLRERMRFEIMEIHEKLGLTIAYVTHDQSEAMVLSYRIILMENQRVAQAGTAEEIYRAPINKFVADFVGLANFFNCSLSKRSGNQGIATLNIRKKPIEVPCLVPAGSVASQHTRGWLVVRPEDLLLRDPQGQEITGTVTLRTFLGDATDYRIDVQGEEWRIKVPPETEYPERATVGIVINRAVFVGSDVHHGGTANG